MAATLEQQVDTSKMTREQKLAALLVILGPEAATEILKGLDADAVANVSAAMTGLPIISQQLQHDILREFSEVAVQATTVMRGGVDFAQATLERALGPAQARQIMGRVAPQQAATSPIHSLIDKEARQIFNAVKTEQPQTIALVISFLDMKKASEVLNLFGEELRGPVIERLASLGPTSQAVVETLGGMLVKKIGNVTAGSFNQTGGVDPAATLLKAMNKDVSKKLLEGIASRDPTLSQSIQKRMFTFEDVAKLDVAALQLVLREVDAKSLATALKTASDAVKTKILSGMSKRAAESINEEIGFLGKVKPKDVEVAQMVVIEIVRKLENDGQIEINAETTA